MHSVFLGKDGSFSPAQIGPVDLGADRWRFVRLQLFRIIIATVLIYFLHQVLDFGVAFGWLALSSAFGIYLAGRLLRSGALFFPVFLAHCALLGAGYLLAAGGNTFFTQGDAAPSFDFLFSRVWDKAIAVLFFYIAAFLSTWLFWCRRYAVTIESVLFSLLFVTVLGSHRNYHLDAPKQLSSLTWKVSLLQRYHVEPQHLIIALGAVFVLVLVFYIVFSYGRPLFRSAPEVRTYGRGQKFISGIAILSAISALFSYAFFLNKSYSEDINRAMEGVGQTQGEGQSPLGFHSALGETRQPSALVRLEGDFATNPWAPMLYLREGALSDFQATELVLASNIFDPDVPRILPGQQYQSVLPPAGLGRERIVQSIYLLSRHNAAFAIDYPVRIGPIKNPDPQKFELAYQAISEAPVLPNDQLVGRKLGSSDWDEATWAHYLRAPGSKSAPLDREISVTGSEPVADQFGEDLRYKALSAQLTKEVDEPIAKAQAIVKFLSERSIYTRNPGHQLNAGGDPVAPYLFSEQKRGYCVHFAHAAVYMMRLAGIPARIATGYLTDLSYAKDGHILLHMGDRHAWPEVFVDGYGWMVFDVTPANAENEQVIVPDEKLLEELMNKLDPAQELLQPIPPQPESANDQESLIEKILDLQLLLPIAVVLLTLLTVGKLWLRHGYRFARNPRRRAWLAYIAFASLMLDLGIRRRSGETRQEYSRRVRDRHGIDAASITKITERAVYAKEAPATPIEELNGALRSCRESYDRSHLRLKRYLAFANPRSLLRIGGW